MKKPMLIMEFNDGIGGILKCSVSLPESILNQVDTPWPKMSELICDPLVAMEDRIEMLRTKKFRKDLFISEATRLGAMLAERMEDAEGWHGDSRVEPAKKALKSGPSLNF